MKISTKGRYGVRLMLDLAINYESGYIPLKEVAARQEISEKYLEQIITYLSRAGLVKSIRGSQGGYSLAMEPSQITVGMVLRIMEGSLSPVACADTLNPECDMQSKCVTVDVWKKVKQAVEDVVDNITFADLVENYHAKVSNEFYI